MMMNMRGNNMCKQCVCKPKPKETGKASRRVATASALQNKTDPRADTALFFLCLKRVASWHVTQQLHNYHCWTVCTLGAKSGRARVWRKPPPLTKKKKKTHVSVCSYHCDASTSLPSHPSPYCCSPSLMGRKWKCCNSGRVFRKVRGNNIQSCVQTTRHLASPGRREQMPETKRCNSGQQTRIPQTLSNRGAVSKMPQAQRSTTSWACCVSVGTKRSSTSQARPLVVMRHALKPGCRPARKLPMTCQHTICPLNCTRRSNLRALCV